jgi:hypothetical protein
MRKAMALGIVATLALFVSAAWAEVDMVASNLTITNVNSQAGTADVEATITFMGHVVPSLSTAVELRLDGLTYSYDPILTLPYQGTGCVYHSEGALGPYCEQTDACDLWYIGRFADGMIPGTCTGLMAAGAIYACYCFHDYRVLWAGVPLGWAKSVNVVTMVVDPGNTEPEFNEANNVLSASAPVPTARSPWGVIKSLYR